MARVGDALPTITSNIPRDLRMYLDRLRDLLNGAGNNGVITRDSLIALGLIDNNGNVVIQDPVVDYDIPPAVTGLAANGAFQNVILTWDQPNYLSHAFTEIWASPIYDTQLPPESPEYIDPTTYAQLDADTATIVAITSGSVVADNIGGSRGRYYWARNVNIGGVAGPFNAVEGVLGETEIDVAFMLEALSGAITTSQLFGDLATEISLISASEAVVGSVNYRVTQEALARAAAITASADVLQAQINDIISVAPYDNATAYLIDDLVVYNDQLYRATAATTGNLPTDTNFWVLLGDYSSLGAVVGQNAANIVELNNVSATSSSANAAALFALQSIVDDPVTGVAATATALDAVETTVNNTTTGVTATASRVSTLETTVNDATTGVAATAAALDAVETTVNDTTTGVAATATRVSSLETTVNNATTGVAATAAALDVVETTVNDTTTGVAATATALSALTTTVGNNTASVAAQATSINGLSAQYTVKVDVNGYVAGYGLASTVVNGTPTSQFIVRADRFAIASSGGSEIIPFIVTTEDTTLNGVTVPAGVYIDQAYIKDGAISSAKIGNLAVDTAQIADAAIVDAKVDSLSAAKITTGFLSADRIEAGSINADKITANSLTANEIAASAITASELAISADADETPGSIFMDTNGAIKVYDDSGHLRVVLGNLTA